MAKLGSQNIVIQISKAVKDNDSDNLTILDEDTLMQLEAVIAELVNDKNVVIEIVG